MVVAKLEGNKTPELLENWLQGLAILAGCRTLN